MTTYTLDNGLRVIVQTAQTAGVYLGLAVAHATRHETDAESGMAHFTEHMTFKGTTRRTSMQIINRLEGVGGELNAYTGKEETVYYAAVQPQHLKRAIDLLTDIVFNSTYPQEEMEREAEVVCDEIESYNDSPAELIFDDFDTLLFGCDHPLGRNILGNADKLRLHTHDSMMSFARRGYRPDNAVLFIYGPSSISPNEITRAMSASMREPGISTPAAAPIVCPPPVCVPGGYNNPTIIHRDVHQAHVMTGCRTIGMSHPDRLALQLLNNILGGPGLNSRLNLALRERAGLVYTVESNYTGYTDCGVWSVYLGCDHSDVKRCLRIVRRELDRLCQSPMRPATLAAAKRQLMGQLAISYDQHESVAIAMGKSMLHYGQYKTQQQIAADLAAITPDHLHRVAQETLDPDKMSTLIFLGKVEGRM